MQARQLCVDRKATGWRGPRCDSRIRNSWRTALRLPMSERSLNLSSRAGGGHVFGDLDCGQCGDPQVVGGGPNPGTVVVGLVRSDRNENISLASGANVAGSFVGRMNNGNVLAGKQLAKLRDIGGIVEPDV